MQFNGYRVPVFTEEESKALHKYLLAVPCSVCGVVAGRQCVRSNGKRMGKNVHMGRLRENFDSVIWLKNRRLTQRAPDRG